MTKLILWVVIIFAGIVWEQVKERRKRRSTPRSPRPAVSEAVPEPPMPRRLADLQGGHGHKESPPANIPAIPMGSIEEEPQQQMQTLTPGQTAALEAHYARWRRAIIDTQVLERKF